MWMGNFVEVLGRWKAFLLPDKNPIVDFLKHFVVVFTQFRISKRKINSARRAWIKGDILIIIVL